MSRKEKDSGIEIVGMYSGDNLKIDDVVSDMSDFADAEKHKEMLDQGFVYVGSYDKDSSEEDIKALIHKTVSDNAKDFYGD